MNRMGFPVRTNGAYSSAMTSRASSLSTPRTTRSGFMKSSIAAPSLRNSGWSRCGRATASPRGWRRAPVPRCRPGRSTWSPRPCTRSYAGRWCAPRTARAAGRRAVLAGRSAHRDEHDLAVLDRGADIGGEAQPPVLLIAAHHRLETGLVDGDVAGREPRDLSGSTSAQTTSLLVSARQAPATSPT